MRTTLRLTIAAIGLAIFSLSTVVVQAEDYTYITNNGTITITGYTGSGGDVTIPDTINGLLVTSIGENAFNSTSLTTVTIPSGVNNIGSQAFCFCTSLTSVNLGNGVTTIAACALSWVGQKGPGGSKVGRFGRFQNPPP